MSNDCIEMFSKGGYSLPIMKKKEEQVNHPERYGGDTTYECIKVLKAWMSKEEYEGFLKGNAIKYICRCGKKDEEIQELEKAKWYLEKLIESKKENKNGN